MSKDKSTSNNRAIPFKETRKRRHFVLIETYTMLIANLEKMHGKARICDIARTMKVSHVSVIKNIKRLIHEGYVTQYSALILLTPRGREMAIFSNEKHFILSKFLLSLGVPENIVRIDVTGMQPYVSTVTIEKIVTHICGENLSFCSPYEPMEEIKNLHLLQER
jgi:DtxR family manganese transport transcriptional regulator